MQAGAKGLGCYKCERPHTVIVPTLSSLSPDCVMTIHLAVQVNLLLPVMSKSGDIGGKRGHWSRDCTVPQSEWVNRTNVPGQSTGASQANPNPSQKWVSLIMPWAQMLTKVSHALSTHIVTIINLE